MELPNLASEYNAGRPRQAADPLGLDGFPERRAHLDGRVYALCTRLQAAGGRHIGGGRLAVGLGLPGTRALRKLVAYARVHQHRHEIVGVPGSGYVWGPDNPKAVEKSIGDNMRRGRCYFYIATLLSGKAPAAAMAQMVFGFMENIPATDPRHDEMAALVAAHGVTTADVLNAMIQALAADDAGRATLAQVARDNASVLMGPAMRQELLHKIDDIRSTIAHAPTTQPNPAA